MPKHFAPGFDVLEDGVPEGHAYKLDAGTGIDVTIVNGVATLDASGGGGGSDIVFQLDGSDLTATLETLNATEGINATAAGNDVTVSVYGAQAAVLASRPAAARSNKRGSFYATDTKTLYVSDGATWTTLFTLGTMASQDASAVAITGGTITGITDLAVADGGTGSSTAGGAATNLGLGTGDSPQFTAVNVGHASDTTLARSGAGDLTVEGNALYRAGGTDVPVTDGGTGASTFTDGGVMVGNGTGALQSTSAGTSGQVLTSNGTGVDPTFQAAAPTWNYRARTTTTTDAAIGDFINCTSGTFTVTLATAASQAGKSIAVKNSGTGVITLATTSGQTMDGVASGSLTISTQYNMLVFVSDGTNWMVT